MIEAEGPRTIWRMHAPQDWSRMQQQFLRGWLGLCSEVRMLITIRNNWDCFIPCVLQVRFELDDSRTLQKLTQSYLPLPGEPISMSSMADPDAPALEQQRGGF